MSDTYKSKARDLRHALSDANFSHAVVGYNIADADLTIVLPYSDVDRFIDLLLGKRGHKEGTSNA